MSEELLQTAPQIIGKYTYYKLGNTTLNQLKANGLIPKRNYNQIGSKKPDGLVLYHNTVMAVIEYKTPANLQSDQAVQKAIKQEINVAKALCKILIITDGIKSYWVNALNGEFIQATSGELLQVVFDPLSVKNISVVEYLIEEIDASISIDNSQIRSAKLIDPTPLATRLWQTIWVATGKSPVKCLYNVVELFIFKFLSDLRILEDDIAFNRVYQKTLEDPAEALDYYAKNSRSKIYKLFPKGADRTTIIDGTIFVNEAGEANLSQAILFKKSLDHLQKYSQEFGSLTKIDKRFKTKLFESFLKQEVEALGQYFTPRVLVQSIIRMAGIDKPSFRFDQKRICDPFCGVGGFPLEILNMNENMRACYTPDRSCKISLPFTMNGFDKGFERDDERTIILAKSNMLIYLAELLFAHPQCTMEFAHIFNETFTLFRDNLGTFGKIIQDETQKYHFILTNPPYVTSGSSIIKEELEKTSHTRNVYTVSTLGLEGLSIQWIIKSLKIGGKAFVLIPDGILARINGKKLRDHILSECYLDAIISLPDRTFFANFEQTYILVITKKSNPRDVQTEPVFTYIVSNIGERLTSIKREEIPENDLPEMERLFHIFMGARNDSKSMVEKESLRCKVQDITRFRKDTHWVVDRWWNREEKIRLGIMESHESASKQEIDDAIKDLNSTLEEYETLLSDTHGCSNEYGEVTLGDKSLFKLFIGKRVLKKDTTVESGNVPLYSANVFTPFRWISTSNINEFERPSILWAIDGNFEFNLLPLEQPFATTDHCGTIQILNKDVVPEYLLYALQVRKIEESFDRSFRASLSNMRRFTITIPIKQDGSFDVEAQTKIASAYFAIVEKKTKLKDIKQLVNNILDRYIN